MNLKIKFRESFRPFAPVVLKERVADYFEMAPGHRQSLHAAGGAGARGSAHGSVNGDGRAGLRQAEGRCARKSRRSRTSTTRRGCRPSIAERHGRFYELVKTFERKTGCPVIINTSFNVRGEPIVCTPEQAYRCFMATNMDVLVLERSVLLKSEQPASRAASTPRPTWTPSQPD